MPTKNTDINQMIKEVFYMFTFVETIKELVAFVSRINIDKNQTSFGSCHLSLIPFVRVWSPGIQTNLNIQIRTVKQKAFTKFQPDLLVGVRAREIQQRVVQHHPVFGGRIFASSDASKRNRSCPHTFPLIGQSLDLHYQMMNTIMTSKRLIYYDYLMFGQAKALERSH